MLCAKKKEGQYMTPKRIVNIVLDGVGYTGSHILEKTVIEPSFGSGTFLLKILERIAGEGIKAGKSPDEISQIIHDNVHGIEKDECLYKRTSHRLDNFMKTHNLPAIQWDNLTHGDTLSLYENFDFFIKHKHRFDFVIGNPPFVNIHNFTQEYKNLVDRYEFKTGMFDMSVAFYEIGISMLNETGVLGFVSPLSLLKNVSQKLFRDSLIDKKYISQIYDFKDSHIFDTADVYISILILDKSEKENYNIIYKEYQDTKCLSVADISYSKFVQEFKGHEWNFYSKSERAFLRKNKTYTYRLDDFAFIKNGIATQRDNVYIGKAYTDKKCTVPCMQAQLDNVYMKFKDDLIEIESGVLHRCVKGSRFKGEHDNTYIVFPYKPSGNGYVPLTEQEFIMQYPKAYKYLKNHKEELLSRDMDASSDWFLFGRNQGLSNSNMKKIVFKHIVSSSLAHISPYILDEDVIVYSGCYAVIRGNKLSIEDVCNIIASPEFMRYCKLKSKSMAGGYFCITPKIVKEFGIEGVAYEM